MSFPPKKVMVIGATSGIGLALAEKYIEAGSQVIAVGRRSERLESFQVKHGKDKVSTYTFDISGVKEIENHVKKILQEHQELDSVVLNAGIQSSFDFSKPETVEMNDLDHEWTTDYISQVHLTHSLLPHLLGKKSSSLIYISSALALVPSVRIPNYSATKAALHSFALSLRRQMKGKSVKVIEILPSLVDDTELLDNEPEVKKTLKHATPLEDFTKDAWDALKKGEEQIFVGPFANECKEGFENSRMEMFEKVNRDWISSS